MSAKRLSLGARWLFAGLLCEADDKGRMLASPRKVTGNVFPDDETISEADVAGWMDELERNGGTIARYEVDGVRYLHIPKFNVHQRVAKPTPSRIPPPPESPVTSSVETREEPVEVREPPVMDLGSRNLDLGNGNGSGSGIAPDALAPLNRGRQNPNAPAPLPGKLLAAVRMVGHTPRAQTITGLAEAEHKPNGPKAWIEANRPGIRKRYQTLAAHDDALLDAVTAVWHNFVKNFDELGPEIANAKIRGWLEDAESTQARKAKFNTDGPKTTVTSDATERTKAMLRARDGPQVGPHPSELPDAMPPEEISALLASVTAKAKGRAP